MTPRLPGAGHLRHWQMVRGRSPGSRVEIVLTCQGLRPRRVHVALAVSHPMMLPSVNSTTSAPGNLIYISWLNGWPVNTPVNASPHTSRYATHDSGTLWIAGPSMVGDFHPLISTGLPAHTVYIYSILPVSKCKMLFGLPKESPEIEQARNNLKMSIILPPFVILTQPPVLVKDA
ncbi:hypothetical protein MS6207_01278 [Escherichia coli]|nr:hypothetical protein [Escherichia coli]